MILLSRLISRWVAVAAAVGASTGLLSADGFSLTHYIRQQDKTVTEQYRATLNGLVQVR